MSKVSGNDFRKIMKRMASIPGVDGNVHVEESRPGVLTFTGELDEWSKADKLCHYAGKRKSVRGVINLIEVDGQSLAYKPKEDLIAQGMLWAWFENGCGHRRRQWSAAELLENWRNMIWILRSLKRNPMCLRRIQG